MSRLAIVAIPREDDYVWKISSEKVPHMTLLFLSEDSSQVSNISEIFDFTKHVINQTLTRFSIEVDHRGTLGPDLADVLFFAKDKWSGFDIINSFRSNLLKNDKIRGLYESIEQYPEWVPHLTLGYPISPAKSDDRDYPGINYVDFDRIAVWYGDFAGIEFPLKKYNFDDGVSHVLMHSEHALYDPVKAHEYYIRTRHLKGRKSGHTYTVSVNGKTHVLSAKQLAEQKVYAAKRVSDIKNRLNELSQKLNQLMAEARRKKASIDKKPTVVDKTKVKREAKQYRQSHKQELATKAKQNEKTQPAKKSSTQKDPVADLQKTIVQVKGRLKAALETQRALFTAKQNG